MILRAILLASLIVGVSAACTPNPATSSVPADAQKYASLKGDATKGRDKFIGSCSTCHGQQAKGLPGLGKDLTASKFVQGLSDAELILFIVKGRAANDPANTTKVEMPPKGGNTALRDQDIADISAFLRTLQK